MESRMCHCCTKLVSGSHVCACVNINYCSDVCMKKDVNSHSPECHILKKWVPNGYLNLTKYLVSNKQFHNVLANAHANWVNGDCNSVYVDVRGRPSSDHVQYDITLYKCCDTTVPNTDQTRFFYYFPSGQNTFRYISISMTVSMNVLSKLPKMLYETGKTVELTLDPTSDYMEVTSGNIKCIV